MLKIMCPCLKNGKAHTNKPNLHNLIACWKKKQKTKSLKLKLKRR